MKTVLTTNRLTLKALDSSSSGLVLDFVAKGREDFEKYESKKDPSFYTENQQRLIVASEYNLMTEHKYARYYVFLNGCPDIIIGTVSFGFFRPFPFASCNIGYKFLKDYRGFGYAYEAVAAAIAEVFTAISFHQIYAYIMPENTPSIKLVEKLGFKKEGISEKCLCVRGIWEDHYVYKLLRENFFPSQIL